VAAIPESEEQDSGQLASHIRGELHDFSLVLGGPLYQLFRKSHLTGPALEHLHRRVLVITGIAWLPLALLAIKGEFLGHAERLAFFRDVEVHVRFLIALPVLIFGELIVHSRLTPVVRRFYERRIVTAEDLPRFDSAIEDATRLRNSIPAEVALILLTYTFGLWLWNSRIAVHSATWYALPGSRWNLTPAGYWYVFVSLPIVQFILWRWYWRLLIWFRFLWHVSRIHLNLIPTHPDRCAGLAFLGRTAYAYGPFLFAQGAMLAGVVASRVLYMGENLRSFKMQIGGFIAFFVIAILLPLLMFTPQMADAKRKGLAEYGQLAQDYVEDFDRKWVRHEPAPDGELLGTGDIQSLADLGNSYSVIADMRAVPLRLANITQLAAVTAAPFVPLLLTVFSPEELIMRLIKVIF
jgi:hypothetical protein